uniref:Diacylglycerol kinase n=1 Tax=Heliothis virescens TaxID=7102 RepID=A0A2A4JB73_HELVI
MSSNYLSCLCRVTEVVKVYDGEAAWTRRLYRPVVVGRNWNERELVAAALRAFHVARDPDLFELTDALAGDEPPLKDPTPLAHVTRLPNKRPALFLRFKEPESGGGEVRVYPGRVAGAGETFVTVGCTGDDAVADLMAAALERFGLDPARAVHDYRCSEILLDRGVSERVLEEEERPWRIVVRLARESVRRMELARFYLQPRRDPHGPTLALFVASLPPGLSERNYENILVEFLGAENKFTSIGPIYYEYGSMVITYEDASKAVRALYALREAKYEDKHLLVMLLPSIEPSMVPAGVKPLLVFVNVKSGGCQGLELISSFRKLLNPYQVFDLENGGPLPGLYVFRHIPNYKILVCGGDGTIGWVLQCLDNVGQDSQCSNPPCAIVPLGTGNDLARTLRWGSGYTGCEDPLSLLRDVIDAEEIRLDRWTVVFHPEDKQDEPKELSKQLPASVTTGSQSEDNSQILVMNNYFGIGIDADLCLDFHNAREENPNKFNSRLRNKGVYVKMGLRKMVGRKMCKDLHKAIRLEVDGKLVELPQLEGIIILNILSWGSGANPWGPEKDDQFSKPNHWDGMLEIVGVTGVVHLGQIQSGLRGAMRIAQGGHIKINLKSEIPVQVDGEPWVAAPSEVVVLKSALKIWIFHILHMKSSGNDLARTLRWGSGYTGCEDPLSLLRDVIDAEEIRLDRWTVVFHPEDKQDEPKELSKQLPGSQSEDNSQILVMNNYFGIGIDADLCLDFHNAREENPNKFNSRLRNKGVYVKMGLRKMVGRKMCKDLHKAIRLEVDGKLVELPQLEGIIILNILSWGSGANPWGPEKDDQFSKPNHWDGMLEIVGVTGVVHLGQIQSGLRGAMRIAQGGHIKINLKSEIPVQVDGEPWVAAPSEVVVLKSALKSVFACARLPVSKQGSN